MHGDYALYSQAFWSADMGGLRRGLVGTLDTAASVTAAAD